MEYNTARADLLIPEYGRNVQEMVSVMKTIEDRAERTQAAHAIINVMVMLNPHLKEQSDYKHKLWDHLYMIAGYDLDVDAPFEWPQKPDAFVRPQKPAYASNHIRFRYYGKNVERMIKRTSELEDGPLRDHLTNSVASYMKMAYRVWNEDKVPDDIIRGHVQDLSDGRLTPTHIIDLGVFADANAPKNKPMTQGGQKSMMMKKKKKTK